MDISTAKYVKGSVDSITNRAVRKYIATIIKSKLTIKSTAMSTVKSTYMKNKIIIIIRVSVSLADLFN